MNLLTRQVRCGTAAIEFTAREFALLTYLLRSPGQTFTRTQICEHVWNYHFDPRTNVVESHLSRLRTKIDKGFSPELIHTVRGAGYCLRAPD